MPPPSLPTVTVTASSSSNLSAGSIAAIVIGSVLGVVLLAGLAFYLLRRYKRHKFTRVANPTHESLSISAGANNLPRLNSRSAKHFTRHSKTPSVSSEPLISPVSWPPIPSTSRIYSPVTPPRSNSLSPKIRDSQYSPAKISPAIGSGSVPSSPAPYILNIPPARKSEQTPPSPKPQQSFFVHRMLQSRARASESISLVHCPSLGFVQGSSTRGSSIMDVDVEQLLADAERAALRDVETAQRAEEKEKPVGEGDDRDEVESSESTYSQPSAQFDHSSLFDPLSRQNSSLTAHCRKSSRRQYRTTELISVAEVPGTPRVLEGRPDSRAASVAANSSLDGQISHGTPSLPMSSVVDHPGTLPLLTSVNFGKDSTASGTTAGSMSTRGWGSNSSGRASRYPSLAPSSIGLSLHSGPRSDDDTDWRHPPPGLSGLKTLQVGPLENPHSPVEERPTPLIPAKRAHLRNGTTSSIPEVERRTVMQGGIAHIDVTL